MRLLFLGDVVGRPRPNAVTGPAARPDRATGQLDFVVVNGENAAGGFGITEAICDELIDAGADAVTPAITPGTSARRWSSSSAQPRLLRPLNYPPGTPGRGAGADRGAERRARAGRSTSWAASSWTRWTIRSRRSTRELAACPLGERRRRRSSSTCTPRRRARSRRWAHFCRRPRHASSSARTPMCRPPTTAILPGGTAYMTDVGMCGDYDSVIGMNKDEPLSRFLRKIPAREVRAGDAARRRCAGSRSRPTTRPGSRAVAPVRHRRAAGGGAARLLGAGTLSRLSSSQRADL